MARASLLFNLLRLEPLSWLEPRYYFWSWGRALVMARASLLFSQLRLEPSHGPSLVIIISSVEARALVMARASLLFLELRLKPLSWLEPHNYLFCWGSSLIIIQVSEAWDTYMTRSSSYKYKNARRLRQVRRQTRPEPARHLFIRVYCLCSA